MIYLLDDDILSVDLMKIDYSNVSNSDIKELIKSFIENAVYFDNGNHLNLDFISNFKNRYPELFDILIKKTNTRIV